MMKIELSVTEIAICINAITEQLKDFQRLVKRAEQCNVLETVTEYKELTETMQKILDKFQKI